MHDPKTVAFDIYLGKKKRKDGSYRNSLLTIWHNDPEKDGSDDSCGWFIRLRHANPEVYEKIVKDFEFEWDRTFTSDESKFTYNCGWFSPDGDNVLSVQGIVLNMYLLAAKRVFEAGVKGDPSKMWDKAYKFLNKNLVQIMLFAENNNDSMRDIIVRKFARGCGEEYTPKKRTEFIRECANIVYTDILRRNRKWHQHPRWHVHHWSIQFHPIQRLKRRFWDKCSVCEKRGFKGAAYGDWNGTKIWHDHCNNLIQKPEPTEMPVSHE